MRYANINITRDVSLHNEILDWLIYFTEIQRLKADLHYMICETIFMTIVIKIRDDLEISGDVLGARKKKRGILLSRSQLFVER